MGENYASYIANNIYMCMISFEHKKENAHDQIHEKQNRILPRSHYNLV